WHNDVEGKLGLALSHPLYHILGIGVKHIAVGEFAYRINLISAVCGALAVANLFFLLRLWLGKNLPAVFAAMTFGLSWTTWWFSSVAEVYTLYLALFLAELIMVVQHIKTQRIHYLYLLAFLNGLAIANHMWGVIPLVCYLVFLAVLLGQRRIGLRHFGIIAGLWIIGAGPYEYLIIKSFIDTGDITGTLASAFFGRSWQGKVLNTELSAKLVKENFIFIAYSFPTPNVIFFFVGLRCLRKVAPSRSFGHILLALLILFFIFAFRYTVPDRYAFFMPFYCLVSVLIGVGLYSLTNQPKYKRLSYLAFLLALLPVPIYAITPVAAQKVQLELPTKRNIPYRNDYIWFLRPWRTGYRGPEQFADEVFRALEDNAVIYTDGTTLYPLLHAQEIKGRRRDIRVVSFHAGRKNPVDFNEQTVPQLLTEASVYVVSPVPGYCPEFLLQPQQYSFARSGGVWRVCKNETE
ncbi:MAG: protein O-mannosyl-transferase family, partial [Planctomycetota bacterium]